jgi:multidrug transporter EmrE-like cation transporter
MFMLLIVGVCIILGSFGQIYMKQGMQELSQEGISNLLSPKGMLNIISHKQVFIGISLYVLATAFWLFALTTLDVSYAYPLLSIGYVLTAALAFVILNENISIMRWSGIALILLGSLLIIRTG